MKNIKIQNKKIDLNWKYIRKAMPSDVSRISEIYVFNNREIYYPIFHNINFSFKELQVLSFSKHFEETQMDKTFVYDDGIVKGFIVINAYEIDKLHIESFFRGNGVGSALLTYGVSVCGANHLWVLKKNNAAIRFYEKHGFVVTSEEELLQGVGNHTEPIVKMILAERVEKENG